MEKLYSKYLIDEHPITFHPTLALAIGINEAILLQKINLWLNCTPKEANGRAWIYNTYKSWHEQLPFFSESTIKRTIKSLDEKGLIIKGNFNKKAFDRTTWYSINYEKLDEIVDNVKLNYALGQNEPMSKCQIEPTYTNEYQMITNNVNKSILKEEQEKLEEQAEFVWTEYPKKEGKTSAINSIIQFLQGKKTINKRKYKLSLEEILSATMKYADEMKNTDKQFICYGSTFYNGRILDYIDNV